MRAIRWWRLAGAAAVLALLAAPALPGSGSQVLAHAQLVASSPGSGEFLAEAPDEIRLVFSEPLESEFTSLDLRTLEGATILQRAGEVDPDDPFALLVSDVPALDDGIYSITWRNLSAADGHTTDGFLYFGVGDSESSLPAASGHGHGETDVVAVVGRWLTYLGLLAAIGLATFSWVVLRDDAMPAQLVRLISAGLGLAALATLATALWSGLESGVGLAYLVDSRTGLLQLARALVATGGALILLVAPRTWTRPIAIGAGLAGVSLLIAAGHASALGIAPVLAGVVHVAAVGVWSGGVVGLLLMLVRPSWVSASAPPPMRTAVPRFSALAIAGIGLVAVTGSYSAWVETGSILPIGTDYARTLIMKTAIVLGALAIGTVNYIDGGRMRTWLDGFATRLKVEALLAGAVLVMSAALATTPPVDEPNGVAIEPLPDAFGEIAPGMAMQVVPGRPGVNRIVVNTSEAMISIDRMELAVQDLDNGTSTSVPLVLEGMQGMADMPIADHNTHVTPNPDGTIDWIADAIVLPAGSDWDATVRILSDDGTELSRQRFAFALDDDGISAGAIQPLITWGAVIALALGVGGAVGLGLGLGGFLLPRCERYASRIALVGGGVVGVVLGLAIGLRQLVG